MFSLVAWRTWLIVRRMRIAGELPSLHISMSDQRLIDILKLVQSIPLPESAPTAAVEEDADANVCRYIESLIATS